jgi:hypothetical protein
LGRAPFFQYQQLRGLPFDSLLLQKKSTIGINHPKDEINIFSLFPQKIDLKTTKQSDYNLSRTFHTNAFLY